MKNLLLDTDTLSYYFKQHPQVVAHFNNHIAQQGSIFAELWQKGKHSGNYDILIAGIAIANDLTLVTNNTKDYVNITDLLLDNWTL